MTAKELTLDDFTRNLASKAPTPGGGGAAALAGALAASLASMVCNLTTGKKKYAEFEGDIQRIMSRAGELRDGLLAQIDADADAFAPLAAAYTIPKDDPARDSVMEPALRNACEPPITIMELAANVIELLAELIDKGSTLAVSDVGTASVLGSAALSGAALNVYINIRPMKDRAAADELRRRVEKLMDTYLPIAEDVFGRTLERLGG